MICGLYSIYWLLACFFFHVLEKREEGEKKVLKSRSKPLKEKTTKAERRALQEAQRAAKAAASKG